MWLVLGLSWHITKYLDDSVPPMRMVWSCLAQQMSTKVDKDENCGLLERGPRVGIKFGTKINDTLRPEDSMHLCRNPMSYFRCWWMLRFRITRFSTPLSSIRRNKCKETTKNLFSRILSCSYRSFQEHTGISKACTHFAWYVWKVWQ